MKGFLGTPASFSADLNLTVQVALVMGLMAGALLARAKRYRAHGACMVAVLLLNLVMIALVMSPSFYELVLPRLVRRPERPSVVIAAAHGALGLVAELLGLYIAMVAGTDRIPVRWRFKNWRAWMRAEFVIWWAVVILGIATYIEWYGVPGVPTRAR